MSGRFAWARWGRWLTCMRLHGERCLLRKQRPQYSANSTPGWQDTVSVDRGKEQRACMIAKNINKLSRDYPRV